MYIQAIAFDHATMSFNPHDVEVRVGLGIDVTCDMRIPYHEADDDCERSDDDDRYEYV